MSITSIYRDIVMFETEANMKFRIWKSAVLRVVQVFVITTLYNKSLVSSQRINPDLSHAIVSGNEGLILGEVVPEGAIFWGIPFSQPPVGKWRWRNPRKPIPYEGNLWNATYARPGCPQKCDPSLKSYICPKINSEDCLYLNIWIPSGILRESNRTSILQQKYYAVDERFQNNSADSLAVMFYLHGGNFIMGSGSAVLYDGRYLASRENLIIVTTNYRLGAIGFLAQSDTSTANFGIKDVIWALKWVRGNIPSFGGNSNKITAVGQSAGAEVIGILLTSPYGKGLFQQAIMQSNPWSLPLRTLSEARRLGDKLASAVGCQPRNITCMKLKSADEIINAEDKVGAPNLKKNRSKLLLIFQNWAPVIDGDLLPRLPISSFVKGKFRKMPTIIGNDKNDGTLFVMSALTSPLGKLIYDIMLQMIGGSLGSLVSKEYPSCLCDNRYQLSKIATDYVFLCPARRVSFEIGDNIWSYVFDATLPWKRIYEKYNCSNQVCHGSELPYLFGTVPLTNLPAFDSHEKMLSYEIQRYWTNFIKYGNPNGKNESPGLSETYWEKFGNGSDTTYNILELRKQGNVLMQDVSNSICNFWDDLKVYGKY